MSAKHFLTRPHDGALIATARGPIGSLTSADYRQEADGLMAEMRAAGSTRLILEMRRAGYFGSHAIELIILLWRYVSAAGGTLVLCDLSPESRDVLQTVGLGTLWPIYDTIEDALSAKAGTPAGQR